ncbi:MAG: bifunctional folylpolyglutamate synthase/dihydrofolate synthase [Verrucomicrobiota bacterium]|nr:bifunctional folylpolyglutamate synthase/dihydrofolate synthase [Verrucomicrobiota bacterium]
MNYSEALAWLYASQKRGIKLGLETVRRLAGELGIDLAREKFIHVAGTNGKGSVCAMIDAIARSQGLKSGLFTSPHLVDFRERIQIDGEWISEDAVAEGLTTTRTMIERLDLRPTFFEITTLLALKHFQDDATDVAVIETGLGGRLDATNLVTPAVSVITRIDVDHREWLGETLERIAREKAGIIKLGVPAISAPQHTEVERVLRATGAEIEFVTEPLENVEVALRGTHQNLNAALSVKALEAAKIDVSFDAIQRGLRSVRWPGRFQLVGNEIVLDGAHNPAAMTRLATTWQEEFGEKKATVIIGILKDKDVTGICAAIAPIASSFIAVPVRSERSCTPEEVCASLGARCSVAENVEAALAIAPRPILVTGSLFLVGEALAILEHAPEKPLFSAQ